MLACLSDDYSIKAEMKKFTGWDNIKGTAIVGVKREGSYFHWVVVSKTETQFIVLDPKTAEVYQGSRKADSKNYTGRTGSNYISLPGLDVTNILL